MVRNRAGHFVVFAFAAFESLFFLPIQSCSRLEDPRETEAYAELLQLYSRLEIGMSLSDVESVLTSLPGELSVERNLSERQIVVYCDTIHYGAKQRLMGIQFGAAKEVVCVMIRVADSTHIRSRNDPKDKVAPHIEIPEEWRVQNITED